MNSLTETRVQSWVAGASVNAANVFASRCALRAIHQLDAIDFHGQRPYSLEVFRALLTTVVASALYDQELSEVAAALSGGLENTIGRRNRYSPEGWSVSGAADAVSKQHQWYPAYYAYLLSNKALAGKSETRNEDIALKDTADLEIYAEHPGRLFLRPLWQSSSRSNDQADWWVRESSSNDGAWRFWCKWYQGFLQGEPLSLELQRRVALIPDNEWASGHEHIARVISEVSTIYETEVAPSIIRDESINAFRLQTEVSIPQDSLQFVVARIRMALGAALKSSSGNAFHENTYEAIVLRDAMENYAKDGSLLATAFYDACLALQKNISDRYPDDVALVNLRNALYAATEEICEKNEVARERCKRLAQLASKQRYAHPAPDDVITIAEVIVSEVDSEVAQIILSDAKEIARSDVVPIWRRARFTNYVTTVALWMERMKKADGQLSWLVRRVSDLLDWWNSN